MLYVSNQFLFEIKRFEKKISSIQWGSTCHLSDLKENMPTTELMDSPKKQTKLTILSKEAQDSEFCLFCGIIEESINYFRDLLTL